MTIHEVLDRIDSIGEGDGREPMAKALASKLCPVSLQTLVAFQEGWDTKRPWGEFVVAQNKVLRECVMLETTDIGTVVREQFRLEPITMDTQVYEQGN